MSLPNCVEGRFQFGYLPVVSDVFSISDRIKEIDERYFIMFNYRKSRYEVHVKGQPDTTLGCVLPFDALDVRALEYVRHYSTERLKQTIREIDEANERLEQTSMKGVLDRGGYKMAEAIRYADHHPGKDGDPVPKELINE